MINSISFSGKISRLPYALFSAVAFFSVSVVVMLLFRPSQPFADPTIYVVPLRSLTVLPHAPNLALMLALVYALLASWVLSALAFRRAHDANANEWLAAAVIVPVVQIPAILYLCFAPPRAAEQTPPPISEGPVKEKVRWIPATQGVIAGIVLTLFSVILSALGFHVYGYGLFVISPFIIGAVAAYLANRDNDISESATAKIVAAATLLGGLALLATALEGAICIVMAAPLGLGMALIGGLLGRAIARLSRRPAHNTLSVVALLPMIFGLEYAFPPLTQFDTVQTISVDAPPALVWNAIVRMEPLNEPLALPYRLGVAYPIRAEILGEGVGATRRGEFSTGIAIERVTEWDPDRKLAFVIENDVPAMNELSPYQYVHAPHAVGYFRTGYTSFELVPRPQGGTEIVERSSHQLKLDPIYYWLPMARWIVHENNARVLEHIRHQAEQSVRHAAAGDGTN